LSDISNSINAQYQHECYTVPLALLQPRLIAQERQARLNAEANYNTDRLRREEELTGLRARLAVLEKSVQAIQPVSPACSADS
jgi:hypothetical protein